MGEAARRMRADPYYGVPSRGLVISPPMEIHGNSIHIKRASLDAQELRYSLLFWDKLVWPNSNLISIGSGPEAQLLEQAKVLSRPRLVSHDSGDLAAMTARLHVEAFAQLEAQEPGRWSLATGERS